MGIAGTARTGSVTVAAPNLVKDAHGNDHNLSLARPSCRWCLGTGIQAMVVTGKDKRECTICRCVTEEEE